MDFSKLTRLYIWQKLLDSQWCLYIALGKEIGSYFKLQNPNLNLSPPGYYPQRQPLHTHLWGVGSSRETPYVLEPPALEASLCSVVCGPACWKRRIVSPALGLWIQNLYLTRSPGATCVHWCLKSVSQRLPTMAPPLVEVGFRKAWIGTLALSLTRQSWWIYFICESPSPPM